MEQLKEPSDKVRSKGKKILSWLLRAIGGLLMFFGLLWALWMADVRGLLAVIPGLILIKLGGGKFKDYFEFG